MFFCTSEIFEKNAHTQRLYEMVLGIDQRQIFVFVHRKVVFVT
jgi:hypothetical protein